MHKVDNRVLLYSYQWHSVMNFFPSNEGPLSEFLLWVVLMGTADLECIYDIAKLAGVTWWY